MTDPAFTAAPPRPNRRYRTAVGLCGALAALTLVGCGSSGGTASDDVASLDTVAGTTGDVTDSTTDGTTADSIDPEDAFLAYTECMRDEGIDLPDPQVATASGDGPTNQVIEIDSSEAGAPLIEIDGEEYQAAQEVCGSLLDDAFGDIEIDPELEAEQRENMLAFAQCMRDQGIDYPDPVFSDNGAVTAIQIGGEEGDGDFDAEAFEAATEECGDLMGPGGGFNIETRD